ncbi:hypothetical protein ES703_107976 [subsurface metagenome]
MKDRNVEKESYIVLPKKLSALRGRIAKNDVNVRLFKFPDNFCVDFAIIFYSDRKFIFHQPG